MSRAGKGFRWFPISLLIAGAPAAWASAPVPLPHYIAETTKQSTLVSSPLLNERHLWVELEGLTDFRLGGLGAAVGAGYRFQYLGFDARYLMGATNWAALRATPSDAGSTGFAEIDRSRANSDGWSYSLFEPGVSIASRMLTQLLPLLSERVRAGIGYGSFGDHVNALSFSGWIFSVETSLMYQLGPGSLWSVLGTLSFNTGALDDGLKGVFAQRQLPVSWFGASAGVAFSF